MLTSRSAIVAYQKCPRLRYYQYHYLGKGIVPARRSIPLTTGTAVHAGVGWLLETISRVDSRGSKTGSFSLDGWPSSASVQQLTGDCQEKILAQAGISMSLINDAVAVAKAAYEVEIQASGLSGKGTLTPQQEEFTILEQSALIEALIRAWALVELPVIIRNYDIYCVERETSISLTNNVTLQSRTDAILVHRQTNDIYTYSLKTAKMHQQRNELTHRHDLQGITEILGGEQILHEDQTRKEELNKLLRAVLPRETLDKVLKVYDKYAKASPGSTIMGARFCFLIKGDRKPVDAGNEQGGWNTINPLIRGYRKFNPTGIEYAHSWYFSNSNNKSGKGALGKGWEPFYVWEHPEVCNGVAGWIDMILRGEVQPSYPVGDLLASVVVVPEQPFYRRKDEVDKTLVQIQEQEKQLLNDLIYLQSVGIEGNDSGHGFSRFRQHRHACYFPSPCDYLPMCWGEDDRGNGVAVEVQSDPIGSGWYEERKPHHPDE